MVEPNSRRPAAGLAGARMLSCDAAPRGGGVRLAVCCCLEPAQTIPQTTIQNGLTDLVQDDGRGRRPPGGIRARKGG